MTMSLYPWHQIPWQHIVSLYQAKRIPHAILIHGIDGLDNNLLAGKLTKSLLCLSPTEDFESCGTCHSCQLYAAESHPDHSVVEPEETGKQIKVDQIRQLKNVQSLMAKISPAKTVIIKHADQMNTNAFNSLLKLLEEPQQNTTLILVAASMRKLPITIKSRCQTISVSTPDHTIALEWLKKLSDLSEQDLTTLLNLAHGAPLAALEIGEEGIEQSKSVFSGMVALMRCKANPVQLSAQWQSFDLISVLHQLQAMIQTKLVTLLDKQEIPDPALIKHYWGISDCIIHTMKLLSSQNNLNKTLLMEDLMVTIMQHASQIQQHQQ
jgi:DNA polymerase-3 subunit delta'